MKTSSLAALALLSALILSCDSSGAGQSSNTEEYIDQEWAQNELWDDGNAEVSIYDAKRVVYGKPRQFEYVYILVKETLNAEYHVKTDDYDRGDLYEVMKVNKFCRIPTEAYPYHYLTSVFLKREQPAIVHKLTNTSQEWCGNTAKSFLTEAGEDEYTFDYISYWDGQGNGSVDVRKGPWWEDQLSYTLRTLKFEDGLRFEVNIYSTQVTNKADIPDAEKATISVQQAAMEELDSAAATFADRPWKVTVTREDASELVYWINSEYPNYMLQMESSDGRRLSLKSLERNAYWAAE